MTVLQMKQGGSACRQVQSWTGRLDTGAGSYRDVITDVTAVRRKSSRRTSPAMILVLVLALLLCILLYDLSSVYTVSEQTRSLSASVASLESSNNMLRTQLSVARNHPVLRSQAEAQAPEIAETILLTAPPAQNNP